MWLGDQQNNQSRWRNLNKKTHTASKKRRMKNMESCKWFGFFSLLRALFSSSFSLSWVDSWIYVAVFFFKCVRVFVFAEDSKNISMVLYRQSATCTEWFVKNKEEEKNKCCVFAFWFWFLLICSCSFFRFQFFFVLSISHCSFSVICQVDAVVVIRK